MTPVLGCLQSKEKRREKSRRETREAGELQNSVVSSKTKETVSRNARVQAVPIETNLNQVILTFSSEPIQCINIEKEHNMTGGK